MENEKWYEHKEKSKTGIGYALTLFLFKFFPSRFLRLMAFVIGFFYWLFSVNERRISKDFLTVAKSYGADFNNKKPSTLKHFISFALNLVETIQGWGGKFSFKNVTWQNDDVGELVKNINSKKGCVCVVSHIGNAQMMRALASMNEAGTENKIAITSVMDTKVTGGFVKLIERINEDSGFHIVGADDFGPETIFLLQQRLEQGEIVVIAGDRIGAHSERYIELPVLGKKAKFPYGVFLLVSLLNSPTYFIFGMRHKDLSMTPSYDMFVTKNNADFNCSRKERAGRIEQTAGNFIEQAEKKVKEHPYQWYNFFNFWD